MLGVGRGSGGSSAVSVAAPQPSWFDQEQQTAEVPQGANHSTTKLADTTQLLPSQPVIIKVLWRMR